MARHADVAKFKIKKKVPSYTNVVLTIILLLSILIVKKLYF